MHSAHRSIQLVLLDVLFCVVRSVRYEDTDHVDLKVSAGAPSTFDSATARATSASSSSALSDAALSSASQTQVRVDNKMRDCSEAYELQDSANTLHANQSRPSLLQLHASNFCKLAGQQAHFVFGIFVIVVVLIIAAIAVGMRKKSYKVLYDKTDLPPKGYFRATKCPLDNLQQFTQFLRNEGISTTPTAGGIPSLYAQMLNGLSWLSHVRADKLASEDTSPSQGDAAPRDDGKSQGQSAQPLKPDVSAEGSMETTFTTGTLAGVTSFLPKERQLIRRCRLLSVHIAAKFPSGLRLLKGWESTTVKHKGTRSCSKMLTRNDYVEDEVAPFLLAKLRLPVQWQQENMQVVARSNALEESTWNKSGSSFPGLLTQYWFEHVWVYIPDISAPGESGVLQLPEGRGIATSNYDSRTFWWEWSAATDDDWPWDVEGI